VKDRQSKVKRFFPNREDETETRYFKVTILAIVGLLVLMVVAGLATFFYFLRGQEKTMVPQVRGLELVSGLMELQEKGLYPQVQVRFSSDPKEKGTIIEQRPGPGTVVKAGRQVNLVVSKGSVVDKVEDFVGQDLNEVRVYIQTRFGHHKQLLRIQEPITYVYDESDPGTIVEQEPEPGTELGGLTDLVLVVSRGPERHALQAKRYVGLDYRQALADLANEYMPFVFEIRQPEEGQAAAIVIAQQPEAGTEMPRGEAIELVMTAPEDIPEESVFGLFKHELPTYPVSVEMRLEAETPSGDRVQILQFTNPGGPLGVPYVAGESDTIVLTIYDREVIREPAEPFAFPEEEEEDESATDSGDEDNDDVS
jgi:beta-lactam-binding protein with PASTA domain